MADETLPGNLAKCGDQLLGMMRPSIRLDSEAGHSAGIGWTKLGGDPDLPSAATWPWFRGKPLAFIAQIDLAQVAGLDVESLLPEDGLLSFFYEAVEQRVWGLDPNDRGGWAVLYTNAGEELERQMPPAELATQGRFREVLLHPRGESTAPPWESYDVERLGMNREERFAFADLSVDTEDEVIHRLLGHPQPIQGDMQLDCQLASHGVYCGDPSGYRDERRAALEPGAADWRLLLQVDSDEAADMMWGDVGRLYFWMTTDALAERRWQDSWLVLQCS